VEGPLPELPEVETVRRGLVPAMEGRRIVRLEARRPDLRFPLPERLADRVSGSRVLALARRAKYLLARLDTGETLLGHLGMSGRVVVEPAGGGAATPGDFTHARATDPAHDHLVFHMEGGGRVTFNDPRRFGYFDLVATAREDASRWLAGLGPEPLDPAFDGPALRDALAGRRTPLKAALLDQAVVAGLGNIYVCEALFRARLSPRRLARSVGPERADRLAAAVKAVVAEAIAAGGSSLRDYAGADGALGYFQNAHRVYGREGGPCRACRRPVARIVQSGRSTFFCPACQR